MCRFQKKHSSLPQPKKGFEPLRRGSGQMRKEFELAKGDPGQRIFANKKLEQTPRWDMSYAQLERNNESIMSFD